DLAALRLKAETAGFEPGKFDPDDGLVDRYDLTLLFTDRPTDAPRAVPIAEVTALTEQPDEDQHQEADSEPLPPTHWKPHEVTTIKFTSGSTGTPKGLG